MTASEVPDETREAVASVRRAMRPRIWLVAAVIILCAVDDWLHPWTLVYQVPWTVKGPSILAGLLVGAWISVAMVRIQDASGTAPGWRSYLAIFLMPFFMAPIGSYFGRRAFETAAFWNMSGQVPASVEAIVDDRGSKRRHRVHFRLEPGQRTFYASASEPIDVRWIGTHCVRFGVYRGRYGAVRLFIPALDMSSFEPCSARAKARYPDLQERAARIEAMHNEKGKQ